MIARPPTIGETRDARRAATRRSRRGCRGPRGRARPSGTGCDGGMTRRRLAAIASRTPGAGRRSVGSREVNGRHDRLACCRRTKYVWKSSRSPDDVTSSSAPGRPTSAAPSTAIAERAAERVGRVGQRAVRRRGAACGACASRGRGRRARTTPACRRRIAAPLDQLAVALVRDEGLVRHAPAALPVGVAGQVVQDGVDVRADVQPADAFVVARVDDRPSARPGRTTRTSPARNRADPTPPAMHADPHRAMLTSPGRSVAVRAGPDRGDILRGTVPTDRIRGTPSSALRAVARSRAGERLDDGRRPRRSSRPRTTTSRPSSSSPASTATPTSTASASPGRSPTRGRSSSRSPTCAGTGARTAPS